LYKFVQVSVVIMTDQSGQQWTWEQNNGGSGQTGGCWTVGNSSNGNPQNLTDRPLEDTRSSSVLILLVVRQHAIGKKI